MGNLAIGNYPQSGKKALKTTVLKHIFSLVPFEK